MTDMYTLQGWAYWWILSLHCCENKPSSYRL